MDWLTLYEQAASDFGSLVGQADGRWDDPTPDTEWTVRDLVNHVLSETLWMAALVRGETIAAVGDRFDGELLGPEPSVRWNSATADTIRALGSASLELTIPLSYGPTPLRDYLGEFATDVVIHGWDLARALGVDDTIDPGLLGPVLERSLAEQDGIRDSGLVGPVIDLRHDADDQARLLAIWGRRR